VTVEAVGFWGNRKSWRGGGVTDESKSAPRLSNAAPRDALNFLRANRSALWRFPKVGPGLDVATIAEAAPLVRKPALSVLSGFDPREFAACGSSGAELQRYLKGVVDKLNFTAPYAVREPA
jgi:hypothetical protein